MGAVEAHTFNRCLTLILKAINVILGNLPLALPHTAVSILLESDLSTNLQHFECWI